MKFSFTRLKKQFPYFLLLMVTIVLVSEWGLIPLYGSSLFQSRPPIQYLTDPSVTDFIRTKTQINISGFTLMESQKPFATMVGLPNSPYLTISSSLYNNFSQPELHYVLLHESGHFILHHTYREALTIIALALSGSIPIYYLRIGKRMKVLSCVILGIFLGLVSIQHNRRCEYEADRFAATHLGNEIEGMITATEKFKAAYNGPAGDSLLRILFYSGVPHGERIKIAQEYKK